MGSVRSLQNPAWTAERRALAEDAWEAQLARLKVYRAERGDCRVPKEYGPLGNWVGKQRQYKRKFDRGEPNNGTTVARVAKLDALGFAWTPRR